MLDLTNRTVLQGIQESVAARRTGVMSPTWHRAYLRLTDAANHLDAMLARTEVRE